MNILNENTFYRLMRVNRTFLSIAGITFLIVTHHSIVLAENLDNYKSIVQIDYSRAGVLKSSEQSEEALTEETSESDDCE